jgi:AraC-like DNA-binding protein
LIIQQELVDVSAGVAPTAALVSLAGGRILVLEPPDNPNFHRSLSEVFQEVCRRVPYASKPPTCAFVDCGIAGLSRAYDVWNTPDLLETLTFLSDGICRYDVDSCASFGKGNPTASNHRWPQDDRGVESLRRALLPRGLIETMAEAYLTGGPRYYSEQELAELRRELRRQWTLCDLVAFVRSHEQDSPHKKGRLEVRRAVSIMEAEFAEPIGLEYVASKVGLSSAYFSRLFRSETGEQFGSRLLRIRVEQAIRLLQSTTMKVYEVAERVGIPNYRYFSVVFKKVTGRQPKEYQGKG